MRSLIYVKYLIEKLYFDLDQSVILFGKKRLLNDLNSLSDSINSIRHHKKRRKIRTTKKPILSLVSNSIAFKGEDDTK